MDKKKKTMKEQDLPNGNLSEGLRQLLDEEAAEAEIEAAMDAALEEGMIVSREEAIKILLSKQNPNGSTDQ